MIIEPYAWSKVKIETIHPASIDTIFLTITRPSGYNFRAGQYAIIRLLGSDGRTTMRQYSFSSAPHDTHIEFTIQKEPGGEVSTWFFDMARPGDEIEISQAFGNFVRDPDMTRPLLFIAGRVGIAPFMSILRDNDSPTENISLMYSVSTQTQVCFESELLKIKTDIFVTQTGRRITREVIASHLTNSPIVYLCGSRQFVEAMQTHLQALDVPASDIRRELFTL